MKRNKQAVTPRVQPEHTFVQPEMEAMYALEPGVQALRDRFVKNAPSLETPGPVALCALFWDSLLGIRVFKTLLQPTPQDHRWVSRCYRLQRDYVRATEHAQAAVNLGLEEAKLELAWCQVQLGQFASAESTLETLDLTRLSRFDLAFRHYVRIGLLTRQFQLEPALTLSKQLWAEIQGIPEFPFVCVDALVFLINLNGRMGFYPQMLYYAERWLELEKEAPSFSGKANYFDALLCTGKLEQAGRVLLELQGWEGVDRALKQLQTCQVKYALCTGNRAAALEVLSRMLEEATAQLSPFYQAYALLKQVALLALEGDEAGVRVSLQALEQLEPQLTVNQKLQHQLYAHHARVRLNEQSPDLDLLENLRQTFREGCEMHDELWTSLHLADAHRRLETGQLDAYLEHLLERVQLSASQSVLSREFCLLPELLTYCLNFKPRLVAPHLTQAGSSSPEPAKADSSQLKIYTLGKELLEQGGHLYAVGPKYVELLAYLYLKGPSRLAQILTDVFADKDPDVARNHFHQMRRRLSQYIPGLNIVQEVKSVYSLQADYPLWCDWTAARAGEHDASLEALFLPSSGSDWVAAQQEVYARAFSGRLEPLQPAGVPSWLEQHI